ncbi:hypothetical protein K7X08_007337 [Anisodus acutangulus]|uniref:Exostosin GT47 domain-containing protein n=1 Tax=Anisodus acutangulus TaxID=402998 RepID=A0A9Q1LFN7_9SOLA|nr:hypothetical protein K7X08_007337 [Anisodus acutangulus]
MMTWSSNSLKGLWFIFPMLLVAAFVVITNPQGSIWLSTSNQYIETLNNGSSTTENQKDETQNVTKSSTAPKRYSKLEKLEAGLAKSRAAILRENKSWNNNQTEEDDQYIPHGPMYLNATAFHRSYLEMEKKFKVYVYNEGEPPVYHFGPCKHTYAIEGYFIQAMEVSKFRTEDPNKAHVYFLPLSVTMLTQFIYVVDSHEWGLMKNTAMDYVNVISQKYPYWNRSLGADHFMLACHDWDNYVNPFSDVLNWDTFAITVPVKDIVNLKKILLDIPQEKYLEMQKRGIQMRRHFEVNSPPNRYDVFHMILHSIWLRRLNFRVHDEDEF